MTPLQKIREAVELALSFAPKGPVPEGLAPMSYHTLNYEDECKLQKRIDEAREALALLDTLKPLSEGEINKLYHEWGCVCNGKAEHQPINIFVDTFTAGYRAAEKRLLLCD